MARYRPATSLLFSSAIIFGAIIIGASLVRGNGDEPRGADSLTQLLQRVEALENRVAQLEKGPQPAIGSYSPVAPFPLEQNRIPENWRPFQFNGQTSYIVPITTSGPTPLPTITRATLAPTR
jgi:hypothetical protein